MRSNAKYCEVCYHWLVAFSGPLIYRFKSRIGFQAELKDTLPHRRTATARGEKKRLLRYFRIFTIICPGNYEAKTDIDLDILEATLQKQVFLSRLMNKT